MAFSCLQRDFGGRLQYQFLPNFGGLILGLVVDGHGDVRLGVSRVIGTPVRSDRLIEENQVWRSHGSCEHGTSGYEVVVSISSTQTVNSARPTAF